MNRTFWTVRGAFVRDGAHIGLSKSCARVSREGRGMRCSTWTVVFRHDRPRAASESSRREFSKKGRCTTSTAERRREELHHVLDTWFYDMAKRKLRGEAFLVRYADDFVIVCAMKSDADKLMAVLPRRFGRYGLTLHPEKTGLVRFIKPDSTSSDKGGSGGAGTFDLLEFTHYWRQSHRGRSWVIGQKTAKSRLTRAIRRVAEWFRCNRHPKVADQHRDLVP
jgi:hypothetical protein